MDNNNQYWIPAGEAVSEFTEKRSRFIGQIRPVNSEADARKFLDEIRKKHRDARHNCWCYIIRSDGIMIRCSDDGEPQGTAGQPILQVFQRREVVNLCCVVTRYFGGVLLGAGGLTRAYARAAKDVLDAAGVVRMELWTEWEVICPYAVLERVKQDAAIYSGRVISAEYGADVVLKLAFPSDKERDFMARVREIAGISLKSVGESRQPAIS